MKRSLAKASVGLLVIMMAMSAMPIVTAAIPGAIWTTDVNGVPVNQNLYANKCDVYLNGGPGPNAPPWAAGLPDGDYYFQVTDPSGSVLLSTDDISERAFRVTGGVITQYLGTTHGFNVVGPPEIVVQLCPFDDTPNPGGEYKVWATLQSDYSPGQGKFGFLPSESKTDNFKVGPVGIPPVAVCPGPITEYEGNPVTFDGSGSYDPDGTIVSWAWDFDILVDSDGDGDPANDADATESIATWTYYDDYFTHAKLTVTDDDGLSSYCLVPVTILNVEPTLEFEGAFIEFELSLRVAGEKWHNVELKVYKNYDPDTGTYESEIGVLEVERWPGPPDQNPSSGGSIPVSIDVSGQDTYTAVVTYDPFEDQGDAILGDQPINGQLWGDNPTWLIFTFPDGTKCRLFHNFNVIQSEDVGPSHATEGAKDHWLFYDPWIVPLNISAAAGVPIKFVATATDPGTDDLTFTWDWGDGSMDSNTHLYDPIRGPDPAYPPGSPYEPYGAPWDPWYTTYVGQTPPIVVTDTAYHAYGAAGTYTVTVTVTDDDGGTASYSFDITVSDSLVCP